MAVGLSKSYDIRGMQRHEKLHFIEYQSFFYLQVHIENKAYVQKKS